MLAPTPVLSYYRHMVQVTQNIIGAAEAAELLHEDVRTVQRKAKAGIYPAEKFTGLRGAYMFRRTDIEALLNRDRA